MNEPTKTHLAKVFSAKTLDQPGHKVLEVGSYDYNGNIRDLFKEATYIGLDIQPGKNVDVVCNANEMPFEDGEFDAVLIIDELEHDKNPVATVAESRRVLKSGGWLVCAWPGIYFPYHPFPADYYRFTHQWATDILLFDYIDVQYANVEGAPNVLVAYGQKP